MDRATKEKALWLLGQKADGAGITYSEIALETGYSKQQFIRLSHSLEESGEAAALAHGNSVSRPHNAARPEEIAYLRKLKEPYPNVTIAHFKGHLHRGCPGEPREGKRRGALRALHAGVHMVQGALREGGLEVPCLHREEEGCGRQAASHEGAPAPDGHDGSGGRHALRLARHR